MRGRAQHLIAHLLFKCGATPLEMRNHHRDNLLVGSYETSPVNEFLNFRIRMLHDSFFPSLVSTVEVLMVSKEERGRLRTLPSSVSSALLWT